MATPKNMSHNIMNIKQRCCRDYDDKINARNRYVIRGRTKKTADCRWLGKNLLNVGGDVWISTTNHQPTNEMTDVAVGRPVLYQAMPLELKVGGDVWISTTNHQSTNEMTDVAVGRPVLYQAMPLELKVAKDLMHVTVLRMETIGTSVSGFQNDG